MKKKTNHISRCILVLSVFLFLSTQHLLSQTIKNQISFYQGDTIEVMVPVVFSDQDIGLAYNKTVTGLKGKRVLKNEIRKSLESNRIVKDIYRFQDDFILNVTGTGQGMYSRKIKARDDIRRASLLIAKINKTSQNEMTLNWDNLKPTDKSLLLTRMEYGNGLSISLSGQKSIFTKEVFEMIKEEFENGRPITNLLKRYNLTPTFDMRGIRSRGRRAEIPTSWKDLESKYILLDQVPIVGQYVLLKDIEARTFDWD